MNAANDAANTHQLGPSFNGSLGHRSAHYFLQKPTESNVLQAVTATSQYPHEDTGLELLQPTEQRRVKCIQTAFYTTSRCGRFRAGSLYIS